MKTFEQFLESRRKTGKYKLLSSSGRLLAIDDAIENVDKVQKVVLDAGEKFKQGAILAHKFQELERNLKDLKSTFQSVKDETREYAEDMFDAGDAFVTRVIEYTDVILTLSKVTQRKQVDYKTLWQQASELFPELQEVAEDMEKDATKIINVASKITVEASNNTNKVKEIAGDLLQKIKLWSKNFDIKLNKLKEKMA